MGIEESWKDSAVSITLLMDPSKHLDPDVFHEQYEQASEGEPDLASSTGGSPPRGFKPAGQLQLSHAVSAEEAASSSSSSPYARQQVSRRWKSESPKVRVDTDFVV